MMCRIASQRLVMSSHIEFPDFYQVIKVEETNPPTLHRLYPAVVTPTRTLYCNRLGPTPKTTPLQAVPVLGLAHRCQSEDGRG